MELTSECMRCLLDRRGREIEKFTDEKKKADYFREIAGIVATQGDKESAPCLSVQMRKAYERYFGKKKDFTGIKRYYNDLMLSMETEFLQKIQRAEDPVRTALVFAQTANYIDFGTGNTIEKDQLLALFEKADPDSIDENEYIQFTKEMDSARRMVLLADNCGEIVLDKLLLLTLKERWPKVSYVMMVRGEPVSNDVVREDALQVGADQVAEIMDNGTDIGGTAPAYVPENIREFLSYTDVILAKGMGNFETAYGYGWPIYYLFLCKCPLFMQRFDKPKYGGMFIHESRVEEACRR